MKKITLLLAVLLFSSVCSGQKEEAATETITHAQGNYEYLTIEQIGADIFLSTSNSADRLKVKAGKGFHQHANYSGFLREIEIAEADGWELVNNQVDISTSTTVNYALLRRSVK